MHSYLQSFFSIVLSDSLSMPNYIFAIFIANVFTRRHMHFVAEEKRTVSYVGPLSRSQSWGLEGNLPVLCSSRDFI